MPPEEVGVTPEVQEKKLTAGEALIVAGKTMVKVGEALDNDNKISLDEWRGIIETAAIEAWKEYQN